MPNAAEIKIAQLEQKLEEHKDKMTDEEYEERAQKLRDEREKAEADSDEVDEAALTDLETQLANLDDAEDPPPAPPPAPPATPPNAPKPPNIFMRGFERAQKFLDNAGTGMLKGIKSIMIMMGMKDWATGLEDYIDRGEVRDLLTEKFGDTATIEKTKNDNRDIKKLKRQYTSALNRKLNGLSDEKKAEMKEDYTFMTYCEERANKITLAAPVAGGEKEKITIARLLLKPEEEAAIPPADETNPDGSPKTNPKEAGEFKETPEHKEAKYTFSLAAALNVTAKSMIVPLDDAEMKKDLKAKKPEYYKQVAKDVLAAFTQTEWTGTTLKQWGVVSIKEAKTVEPLGLHLSGETLEARDASNWAYNNNEIDNFRTLVLYSPEAAVQTLLSHNFTSGKAAIKMPVFKERLKEELAKYGVNKPPETIPPAK